jgi:hypothetical protein
VPCSGSRAPGRPAVAGAEFQHAFVRLDLRVLQQPGLDARRQHAPARGQGQLGVAKGEMTQRGGHEVLAPHQRQQLQHGGVQDLPGPDLLLDHVEAGLLEVHRRGPL